MNFQNIIPFSLLEYSQHTTEKRKLQAKVELNLLEKGDYTE